MEHSTNGVSGSGIFHSLFRRDAMYKIVIITSPRRWELKEDALDLDAMVHWINYFVQYHTHLL